MVPHWGLESGSQTPPRSGSALHAPNPSTYVGALEPVPAPPPPRHRNSGSQASSSGPRSPGPEHSCLITHPEVPAPSSLTTKSLIPRPRPTETLAFPPLTHRPRAARHLGGKSAGWGCHEHSRFRTAREASAFISHCGVGLGAHTTSGRCKRGRDKRARGLEEWQGPAERRTKTTTELGRGPSTMACAPPARLL